MDFADPNLYISFAMLAVMEIVLGIDNIIFITILCGRLPDEVEHQARRVGIAVALVSRILLLLSLSWVMKLTSTVFNPADLGIPFDHGFSWRDFILLFGGLFLIGKATHEIYENVEHPEVEGINDPDHDPMSGASLMDDGDADDDGKLDGDVKAQLAKILAQVLVLDIVFSLDSVITAVGMAKDVPVMAAAMITAVVVMLIFAGPVGDFVQRNPSVRILALAFLVLIGVMLTVEGMGQHVSKGYIYSAISFSLLVELFNLRRAKKTRKQPLSRTIDGGGAG